MRLRDGDIDKPILTVDNVSCIYLERSSCGCRHQVKSSQIMRSQCTVSKPEHNWKLRKTFNHWSSFIHDMMFCKWCDIVLDFFRFPNNDGIRDDTAAYTIYINAVQSVDRSKFSIAWIQVELTKNVHMYSVEFKSFLDFPLIHLYQHNDECAQVSHM